MSPDEMLAKMREQRRHRRGRPRLRAADMSKGMFRFVHEVFDLEHELGPRRGARLKALREIAHRHDLDVESFRRFVHRHRHLRDVAAIGRSVMRLAAPQDETLASLQRCLDEMEQTLKPLRRSVDEIGRAIEGALTPI